MATNYTAKDITVLEGLEPVRKRPGMYIGGVGASGLHHLVWEVLDNAIDEAMNGYASNIAVTLHDDASAITISDDGRGIPVDKHPKTKKSALEVIFSTLHAGGKFDAGNYKTAGGLHGVGASVVNALSKELVATVRRDGSQWEMRFKQGAVVGGLKKLGAARGSGTTVFFRPDSTIFPKVEFDAETIRQRLEISSYLHKGVKIVFEDEAQKEKHVYQHSEGLADYLKKIVVERSAVPVHDTPFSVTRENDENGIRLDVALQWTQSTDEHVRSYVNGIPTGSGGTHENGFRAGLGKAVRNFIDTHNLSPKGVTLTAEDIREGLVAVLSVFVQEPQFQGQTKDRLNNPEVMSAVDSQIRPALEHWLNTNSSVAESIVARIILAARAREASRAAQQEVARKTATSGRLTLPGKLSDCTNRRSRRQRDVHRRGRFRRRLGEAGPRPGAAGDPAAPRQGAEHRERVAGEGPREQGALRSRDGSRLRARQDFRPGAPALRSRDHPRRRRLRRPPHRHAAADVHLPAHGRAHHRRVRVSRAAAALPHRHRQGNVLGAGRGAQGPAAEAARQRPREAGDHALQGPRRDDAEGAVGDDAEPAHAPPAARGHRGPASSRIA